MFGRVCPCLCCRGLSVRAFSLSSSFRKALMPQKQHLSATILRGPNVLGAELRVWCCRCCDCRDRSSASKRLFLSSLCSRLFQHCLASSVLLKAPANSSLEDGQPTVVPIKNHQEQWEATLIFRKDQRSTNMATKPRDRSPNVSVYVATVGTCRCLLQAFGWLLGLQVQIHGHIVSWVPGCQLLGCWAPWSMFTVPVCSGLVTHSDIPF